MSDTGIGLSQEVQQRIFQPFTQADDSMTRRYGGTGLGLAICARLVELMHGEIGVESSEDAGATFWFSVPLAIPVDERSSEIAQANADLHGLRVLVVDDNEVCRNILTTYLSTWKSICMAVQDGIQALEELRRAAATGQPYTVAILDMMMPDMSGITLATTIKEDPSIASTELIALTAFLEGNMML